jgi:hypothetical protein
MVQSHIRGLLDFPAKHLIREHDQVGRELPLVDHQIVVCILSNLQFAGYIVMRTQVSVRRLDPGMQRCFPSWSHA